jgi:hypothetical protein
MMRKESLEKISELLPSLGTLSIDERVAAIRLLRDRVAEIVLNYTNLSSERGAARYVKKMIKDQLQIAIGEALIISGTLLRGEELRVEPSQLSLMQDLVAVLPDRLGRVLRYPIDGGEWPTHGSVQGMINVLVRMCQVLDLDLKLTTIAGLQRIVSRGERS